MLTMLELWSNYEPLRLCSLSTLPQVQAIDLDKFKEMQHTHCERVVQTLKKKWFPSVVDIFRTEGGGRGEEGDVPPALLSAASTLMFVQLRELLRASISELLAFFEKYATRGEDDFADESAYVVNEDVTHRPLFMVKMAADGESFTFTPSLSTFGKSVLGIVDHFVAMLNTMPRVESELSRGSSSRLLTVATADEEVVVHAKQRLTEIIELNFAATETMRRVYEPYAYLLSADTEAQVVAFTHADKSLSETTTEVGKYEKARKEADKRSLPAVRFNLLTVSCDAARHVLNSRAVELCDRLRHSVKAAFLSSCNELCSRYMEIFVRLGHHPTTDDEMV